MSKQLQSTTQKKLVQVKAKKPFVLDAILCKNTLLFKLISWEQFNDDLKNEKLENGIYVIDKPQISERRYFQVIDHIETEIIYNRKSSIGEFINSGYIEAYQAVQCFDNTNFIQDTKTLKQKGKLIQAGTVIEVSEEDAEFLCVSGAQEFCKNLTQERFMYQYLGGVKPTMEYHALCERV
jgi:hypothetical protein